MKLLISFLSSYRKPLVVLMLTTFALWGFSHWRYVAGQRDANQAWSLKWSQRNESDIAAKATREAAERAEEQRRQRTVEEEQKHADEELAQARATADAADRAAGGLQQQLAELQRKLSRSETGRISALADASQARGEAAVLLTQLLSESDKAAGEYAKEADRAYIAGKTCERLYEKIMQE